QLNQIQSSVNNDISLSGGVGSAHGGLNSGRDSEQKKALGVTDTNQMSVTDATSVPATVTPTDTMAYVGAPGTTTKVTAGGSLEVKATETIHPSTALVGRGTAGTLSVGGSVAVVHFATATQAIVYDGAQLSAGGTVTVEADYTDNLTAKSYAGSAGFVGLGAQVSIIADDAVQ